MTLAARLQELIAERGAANDEQTKALARIELDGGTPVYEAYRRYELAWQAVSKFMNDNEAAILRALKESEHG
jgi:hypothetical protein